MKNSPRYLAIAQDIITQIQEGKLRPGDQIMTEAQLCEEYVVSRMTVNKALTTLVTKGFVQVFNVDHFRAASSQKCRAAWSG